MSAIANFPNLEAEREEQRNFLKHVVGRIDVFAVSPTGFAKSLIFQLEYSVRWNEGRIECHLRLLW